MDPAAGDSAGLSAGPSLSLRITSQYQKLLDDVNPYSRTRWVFMVVTLLGYLVRTYLIQGWYIVTYALGIYLLNLLIAFLTPKIDPAIAQFEDDEDGDLNTLPTKANEEFKPFIRRLPEFKFWYQAQRAVVFAIFATFFQFFNVPVFWPILVLYFFILFGISMKQRIKHMIKYKYVPFSFGKPKHKGKEDAGKVVMT